MPPIREFDKTLRLVMPFVLLLICIFIIAMRLSGPTADTGLSFPFGSSSGEKKSSSWFEPGWDAQLKAVKAGQSDKIEVTQELIGDQHLLQLKDLNGLRELLVEKAKVTDAGVAPLTTLRGLQHLRLRGSKIHDNGFKQLCSIVSLRNLNLPQADLTDAGLDTLVNLQNLELLRISSPRVTDAGVQMIARVKTLRWLHLIDIPITDASLKSIGGMRNLESLYLDGARISDTAYEQLFRTRPDLHVHINQQHHDRDPHKTDHAH